VLAYGALEFDTRGRKASQFLENLRMRDTGLLVDEFDRVDAPGDDEQVTSQPTSSRAADFIVAAHALRGLR